MLKRTITGLVLIAVLLPLLIFDKLVNALYFVFGLLVIISSYEMLKLNDKVKPYSRFVKIVVIMTAMLVYLAGISIFESHNIKINPELELAFYIDSKVSYALLIVSILAILSIFIFVNELDAVDVGKLFMASFYPGFGLSAIVILRTMGLRYVVYLFLITILTDVFAYFYGMLFGKHKMVEHISPKKTWEGAVGGTIIATLVASMFASMYGNLFYDESNLLTIFDIFKDFPELHYAVRIIIIVFVTLIASICSQIGDLVASKIKRSYDVKDFGKIFPGHGGVLDRFDSAIFTSMALVAVFLVIMYAL